MNGRKHGDDLCSRKAAADIHHLPNPYCKQLITRMLLSVGHTPLLIGLVNYFERHLPYVGYYAPIGGSANPDKSNHPIDRQLRLIHDAFEFKYDVKSMMGVSEEEAVRDVAAGKRADLTDRIYAAFQGYREMHDMVIVHGTSVGSGKLDAEIASAISSPAVIACQAKGLSLQDITRKVMLKKALMDDHKVSSRCSYCSKQVTKQQHHSLCNIQ